MSAEPGAAARGECARIAAGVASGALRAEDVVSQALQRIAARTDLNAIITLCADEARGRAAAGVSGRLAGVPLVVKDLIDTAGVRTTYASRIYADHVPDRTAPCVAALEAEGAIVVAKANADEFAWGVAGQNEHYGDIANPLHPGRIAGGSSAGNAAALAAGLVPLALGTDTGGSVRMPAAACGVVGLKPERGATSLEGVFRLAASFDTVGPMARSVADCALAHAVLTGTAVPEPRLAGRRVGVLAHPPDVTGSAATAPRDARANGIAARLRALGAHVCEVEVPRPAADTWPVFYADAADAHAETFPSRAGDYGRTVRAKLEMAASVAHLAVREARDALGAWRAEAAYSPEVDLIASPTLGLADLPDAGVNELDIRLPFSAYTRAFSYLGWAAIAIGDLHLAARDADTVITAALAIEAAEALRRRATTDS